MKYFENCHTLEDLKAEYRRLVKLHHPDCGGDTATMQAINDEHDRLFEILKRQHNAQADEYHQTTETAEEFRNLINELLKLDGIICELCGNWLWISGNTKSKYYLEIKKVYDVPGIDPETIDSTVYPGAGRSQAIKDFEAYQKSHPGIIAVKDIEKGKWER